MKISLITASLNRCNVLMETLLSAIAQRDVDLEMIVVDGASTDGTVAMLQSLSTKEPRLKWMSKPDTGVYQAINRGIEMSTGDIIGFLNAGDHFTSPDVLKYVVEKFAAGAEMIYGDVRYANAQGRITRRYHADGYSPQMLRNGFAPPHPSLYVSHDIIRRVGPYRENYIVGADFEYFVRLMIVNGIEGEHIPMEMVEMATGGLSTKWRHRLWTNILEKRRAFHHNNLPAPSWSLLKRYIYLFKR